MTTRGRAGETPRSFLWATLLTAPLMMSSGKSSRYSYHCQFESNNVTISEFRALFERYGRVVEADVMTDKNFGFVHVDAGMGEETISENYQSFVSRSREDQRFAARVARCGAEREQVESSTLDKRCEAIARHGR